MHFKFSSLALTASLLVSASVDIPTDLPLEALLSTAQSHLAKRQTTEALAYYDAAISWQPDNYLTLFKRATTYLSLGRDAQATDDLTRVLALKPGFEGAYVQLAKIKARSADWSAAKSAYRAAGKGTSSSELTELVGAEEAAGLAEAAKEAGRWDDCIYHSAKAIVVASKSAGLRQVRANCRLQRGHVEEALSDLKHVVHLRPGDTDPHVVISAIAFYGLGDMEGGLSQARKCLHSDPDSKICNRLHKQQKLIHKQYVKAEGQLKKDQPTTAGRTLVGSQAKPGLVAQVEEQVQELRQSGKLHTKIEARLFTRVVEMVCQAHSESNHKDASKYCEELKPDSFWALMHRGKTMLKNDHLEAAIEALEKAAELQPDQQDKVSILLNKARIALKRSKTKDYYKILGVTHDADDRQIKSAYRKQSKQYHPDKAANQGIDRETAEKKMAAINEAYEVLSDAELRARFDRGDDPNSSEKSNPFADGSGGPPPGFMFQQGEGGPFMFQQHGGGSQQGFKFHFGGGGGPFGF
ncbi:hypothetical protein CDD81_5140 [Ophiocordyceps australis]|uniref:J domain-containing protein n=1 Tax=Ophiocordyceps australis TaxID=1399860 RepID=A0A2C5XU35_9HYPO|nr:hypothetical protein CDD81_5140 [Ophiocordyceps australis]